MFLGDYLETGGERKGDEVWAFLPGFVAPQKQADKLCHSLRWREGARGGSYISDTSSQGTIFHHV